MATVQWADPVQRRVALQTAYYDLISGQQTASVTYEAQGVTRTVQYSRGDLALLKREIVATEAELSGTGPRVSTIYLRTSKGL